ncbi:MAG TPA: hypothetical protein VGQ73_00410 [Gemmatimonadales bacterium]|nr:hypothetical protein [Gemmatimonadales bacterium]
MALITAKGDFAHLGIKAGEENYYFVYKVGSRYRSAVLNATTRTQLPNTRYKKHSPTADLMRDNKGTFTLGAYECAVVKRLKACFVDSPTKQNLTVAQIPVRFGIGLLLVRLRSLLQPTDESQPWAACPEFGCCCGGTNCHPGS